MKVLVALLVLLVAAPVAEAKNKGKKVKVCATEERPGKKPKRKCRYHREFEGQNAKKDSLRTAPLERPSGKVWVRSENLQEEVEVQIYAADGSFDDAALAKLDEVFRCKRSHEVRAVDPRLYEQLSRIQDHFGGAQVVLVSGFRYKERTSSRHWHASAMDIRIEDVPIRDLYDFAESLDSGGMGIGIYPNSGFVHVDYRAPGEPSFRWTDWSYPDGGKKRKKGQKGKKKR